MDIVRPVLHNSSPRHRVSLNPIDEGQNPFKFSVGSGIEGLVSNVIDHSCISPTDCDSRKSDQAVILK